MVAARHNLTRRALLGAGAGACAIAAAPPAPAVPSTPSCRARWGGALAALRSTEAACEAFRVRRLRPAADAHRAIRGRWPLDHDCRADPEARALLEPAFALVLRLEDQADDLECARLAALRRLLRLPAPDLAALAL